MSARIALLKKTPFVLDPRPLTEASSPHAGLLATSRVYRSLGVPDLIAAALKLRKRQRGYSEGQMIESLVLLQTVGGACPEDMSLLTNDPCLERGLGYPLPKSPWASLSFATARSLLTLARMDAAPTIGLFRSAWWLDNILTG